MLQEPQGYKLVSLKCNNPQTSAPIKGRQLPVLLELSGKIHHPVGVIVSAIVGEQVICELDYCSKIKPDPQGCLASTEDGTITEAFPEELWLTSRAENISQLYVLYLVKTDDTPIITAVKPADSETAAGFEQYEGFAVK